MAATIRETRLDLAAHAAGEVAPWLACRESCPPDPNAPLLIFLHGFPEAAFVWDGMLAHFGKHYRCVAPNLRGYPGSYAPAKVGAYRAQVVLMDLIQLIQAHHGPAAAVIAHDWGGALAWGLAAVAPQTMQRLVILNAPHPGLFLKALRDDPAQQAASQYMNTLRQDDAETALQAQHLKPMWSFFEHFGGAGWLTSALREQYRQAWTIAPTGPDTLPPGHLATSALTGPLNYYRASPLHPPTSPQDPIHTLTLPDGLLRVTVPTTVVWGEADTALPPSLLEGLDQFVPDLHIDRIPSATHWLVHEAPAAVIQSIEAALAR